MEESTIQLLELIEKLESRVNTYWNFYAIVVIAAGGWLLSTDKDFSLSHKTLLTIALALFFLANLAVSRAATRRVIALESELNKIARGAEFASVKLEKELTTATMPGRLLTSTILHLAVDVAVIATIWI